MLVQPVRTAACQRVRTTGLATPHPGQLSPPCVSAPAADGVRAGKSHRPGSRRFLSLLRSVATSHPWYLKIARASPDDHLAAHYKLKRRQDFTSTERELAHALANHDPTGALVLSNLGSGTSPLHTKVIEAFVTSKCPAIKYKHLLLPQYGGSMDRARRHFQELMSSPDPLVAALASERDFLCAFVEKQQVPLHKKSGKGLMPSIETPYHALVSLRFAFKALSVRIKRAAALNEDDLILFRAWYSDVFAMAHSHTMNRFAMSAAEAWRQPLAAPVESTRGPKRMAPDASPAPRSDNATTKKSKSNPVDNYRSVNIKSQDGVAFRVPDFAAKWFRNNITKKQARQIFEANSPKNGGVFRSAFMKICKNCWFSGRGAWGHTLTQCQKQNYPCGITCPKCQGIHWEKDCPAKR